VTNECELTSKSKKKTTIESHYWMWNVDESQDWNFKLLFIFSYHFIKQWYHISLWHVVNISRLWLSCDFSIIFDFLIPKQNGFSIIWFERTLWRLFLKRIVRTHRDIPTCVLLSLSRHLCWWIIIARRYDQLKSQCFKCISSRLLNVTISLSCCKYCIFIFCYYLLSFALLSVNHRINKGYYQN
jgi:hypothetical protein